MSTEINSKLDRLTALEQGHLGDVEVVALFQSLIDDRSVWRLQGQYGRVAIQLIKAGKCTLGPTSCQDYFGNRVPSRYEVKAGLPGSPEFVIAAQNATAEIESPPPQTAQPNRVQLPLP